MRFYALNVLHNHLREHAKRGTTLGHIAGAFLGEKTRSPQWPHLEKQFKAEHPTCAACAGTDRLNVHHKKPFHLEPSLELDPDNLITLCMGKKECHLLIGHGDNFRAYNPDVAADAATVLAHPDLFDAVAANAKSSRQMSL